MDRLRVKFSAEKIIAAGDGEQDISMLNNVDISVFPSKFADIISSPERIVSEEKFLSDEIIKYLKKPINADLL